MSNWIDEIVRELIGVAYDSTISSLLISPLNRIQVTLRSGPEQDPQLLQQQGDTPAYTTFKYLKNNQGVSSLWRGTSLLILKTLPTVFTDFLVGKTMMTLYTKCITPTTSLKQQDSIFLLTLGTGTLCAWYLRLLVQSPFEVLYTRMALDTGSTPLYSGPRQCLELTTRNAGSKPLFTGVDAAFVGSLISDGGSILSREIIARSVDLYRPGFKDYVLFLSLSTVPYLLAYPFFTVRTRMIAEEQRTGKKPVNWVAFMKSIVQNEGMGSLYNGLLFSLFSDGCKVLASNAARELLIALITDKLATAEASL